MNIKIPISPGELIDRITILEIKTELINDKNKILSLSYELVNFDKELKKIFQKYPESANKLKAYKNRLHNVNLKLWNVEDKIRKSEAEKDFNKGFVASARNIYRLNDRRSEIKNNINRLLGSKIREVKQYAKY